MSILNDDLRSKTTPYKDLIERLLFAASAGRIWLNDQRMVLLHAKTFARIRRELIDAIGMEEARTVLMRIGYEQGMSDAVSFNKEQNDTSCRGTLLGDILLQAVEGFAQVVLVKPDLEKAFGEWSWLNSCEAEAHLAELGSHSEPVCWMQTGYMMGYASRACGTHIVFREVECRGMGATHCRLISRPAAEWGDVSFESKALGINLTEHPVILTPNSADLEECAKECNARRNNPVGRSPSFLAAQHMVEQVAETGSTVLLLGETGTGKEMFASQLHDMSSRQGPFVAINCAAIPDELFEAELFGVEKGAYTGANLARAGRFERAENGTLFLDEIPAMSFSAQGKLLRALQEREIERVGGSQTIKVNVRIVAASNVDLWEEVQAGRFREDLFFRLNVFPITLPPLKERRDDIPLLIDHFIGLFSEEHGRAVKGFTLQAKKTLLEYDYPGNIRELRNLIERGVISVGKDEFIDIHHMFRSEIALGRSFYLTPQGCLQLSRGHSNTSASTIPDQNAELLDELFEREETFTQIEQQLYTRAFELSEGNISATARTLGLSRPTLEYRLQKLGLFNGNG